MVYQDYIRVDISSNNFNHQEIQLKIDKIYISIASKMLGLPKITALEMIRYFDGDAPSGDTTTISDILANEFLLLHEIVEIAVLKTKNLKISGELLFTEEDEVEKAHIIATILEIEFAKELGEIDWIYRRVANIENWKKYPELPMEIKNKCKLLSNEFKEYFV